MSIEKIQEAIQKNGYAELFTKVSFWSFENAELKLGHSVLVHEITDTHVVGFHNINSELTRNNGPYSTSRKFRVKHNGKRFRFGGGSALNFSFNFENFAAQ